MSSLGAYLREISVPAFIIVCLFALSSWIDINGVWVEVPLLVNELPEGWNLPSYLVIIIQLANIGPGVYTIAKKLAPDRVKEWPVVYIIISIGMVSCALLVFFWSSTSYINGVEHSTALLVLSFFLALVDCTSSVVYLPYMAAFTSQYLTALFVGEGMSGLLPALIGLAQGVGGDPECLNVTKNGTNDFEIFPSYSEPRFSVSVYFGILFIILCISMTSFSFLHFHPRCRNIRIETGSYGYSLERAEKFSSDSRQNIVNGCSLECVSRQNGHASLDYPNHPTGHDSLDHPNHPIEYDSLSHPSGNELHESTIDFKPATNEDPTSTGSPSNLSNVQLVALLALVGWINALTNGVLPSLQSYSCLPYGNLAYSLTVQLSVLVNPLSCFVALFFSIEHLGLFGLLTTLGTLLSAYQITLAALSPYPPLYDQTAGVVLVILTYVLLVATFSYVKVCIAGVLGRTRGSTGLLYCGIATQIGSLIGAIITFVLVNIQKLFESKYPCT